MCMFWSFIRFNTDQTSFAKIAFDILFHHNGHWYYNKFSSNKIGYKHSTNVIRNKTEYWPPDRCVWWISGESDRDAVQSVVSRHVPALKNLCVAD